ncbi:MAG: hypothetical protein KGO96_13705 [Elusimicrobia bacterium]|nr:hypothetical protein [Elusimicrobiota bacterium]MDE2236256.1 hypothetical protein [Elusimicrobiota bacterium]MDE2426950.1 hypothetical protein [Elusimicrobiota bacterium]
MPDESPDPKVCPHLTVAMVPQKDPLRPNAVTVNPLYQKCVGEACACYWACQVEPFQRRALYAVLPKMVLDREPNGGMAVLQAAVDLAFGAKQQRDPES